MDRRDLNDISKTVSQSRWLLTLNYLHFTHNIQTYNGLEQQ